MTEKFHNGHPKEAIVIVHNHIVILELLQYGLDVLEVFSIILRETQEVVHITGRI